MHSTIASLEQQAVPRPEPSQYPAIEADLQRFATSLGSVSRITALLDHLEQTNQQVN